MENDGKNYRKKRVLSVNLSKVVGILIQCNLFVSRTYFFNLKHWFEGYFSIFQKFEEFFNLIDYFLI